jgi:hypothetical protein
VACRANTSHEVEDDCMVMGVGAIVERGGDRAEEGEGRWVSVVECRFREENERHMTGSNSMETMSMEKTENDVDTMHVERIGINDLSGSYLYKYRG